MLKTERAEPEISHVLFHTFFFISFISFKSWRLYHANAIQPRSDITGGKLSDYTDSSEDTKYFILLFHICSLATQNP